MGLGEKMQDLSVTLMSREEMDEWRAQKAHEEVLRGLLEATAEGERPDVKEGLKRHRLPSP